MIPYHISLHIILNEVKVNCAELHYNTFRSPTWHKIEHCNALQNLRSIPFPSITFHSILLHYITLHYTTLHSTLHNITSHYTTLCYMTSHCIMHRHTCIGTCVYTYIYIHGSPKYSILGYFGPFEQVPRQRSAKGLTVIILLTVAHETHWFAYGGRVLLKELTVDRGPKTTTIASEHVLNTSPTKSLRWLRRNIWTQIATTSIMPPHV